MRKLLFILPFLLLGLPVLQADAAQVKEVLCYHDPVLCPTGNFTVAYNISDNTVVNIHVQGCADGQFQKWQSSNSTWICSAGGSGLASINGDSTAAQLLKGTSLNANLTVNTASGTTTFNLGQSVLVLNGTDQPVTKTTFTINNLKLGGQVNFQANSILANTHTITLPQSNSGTICLTNQTATCGGAPTDTDNFLVSLNGDTTSAQLLKANSLQSNLTINDNGATHTVKLGQSVLVLNGTDQPITKSTFTINNLKLGGQMNLNTNTLQSSGHVFTFPSNTGTICLSNQTGTCGAAFADTDNFLTSINSDTTAAQILQGQLNNITATTSAGTTTFKLGTNVVVLGNNAQTFTKALNFQGTSDFRQSLLNIGSSKFILRNPLSTQATTWTNAAQTSNNTLANPVWSGTATLSLAGRTNFTMPANQTGTSSRVPVMLNGFATFTPRINGNATIFVTGITNSTSSSGGCRLDIRQNTAWMGTNGATATGTLVGQNLRIRGSATLSNIPFEFNVYTTSLTGGTKYYFDLTEAAAQTGTCAVKNLTWLIKED